MIQEETFTCIVCPKGCELTVTGSGDSLAVAGASCKRGEAFAREETEAPTRTLTTTVRTAFPEFPRLPVRTETGIPLASFAVAMAALSRVTVSGPVSCGDVVVPDLAGLGVAAISTADLSAGTGA